MGTAQGNDSLVQRQLGHRPSVHCYQLGCGGAECRELNRLAVASYRARRKANHGLPLTNRKRAMPSLMTRLRREIGVVAPWRN